MLMNNSLSDLFNVRDKVILVTGGSRGVGKMIAECFVANGARVYNNGVFLEAHFADTFVHAIKRHVMRLRVNFLRQDCFSLTSADLSKHEQIMQVSKELSLKETHLHVLVNNAGANWAQDIAVYSSAGFDKVIQLNLTSMFFLTQALLPMLEKSSSEASPAAVVNIGSINGIMPPAFETYAYSASKAGLHMLTKHMALKLGPKHITVNAIAPGSFPSKMMQQTLESFGDKLTQSNPMRRLGRSEDIGAACIYLASRGGSYVNGSILVVDGGAIVATASL